MMHRTLSRPRIESRPGFTAVGIARDASPGDDFGALWDRFGERYDEFAAVAAADAAIGVGNRFSEDSDDFRYLAGVEFDPFAPGPVPADATRVEVPGGQYVVFETTLDAVSETRTHIYDEWLPESVYERRDGPEFEHYEAGFDHATNPWFTVWVPIEE